MIECISIVVPYKFHNESVSLWFQPRLAGEFQGMSEFPGGKLEPGESSLDCAIRELKEETGIDIKAHKLFLFKVHKVQIQNKNLALSIYLTDETQKFQTANFISFSSSRLLDKAVNTLPANYKIIEEILDYLFSLSGRTNLTVK